MLLTNYYYYYQTLRCPACTEGLTATCAAAFELSYPITYQTGTEALPCSYTVLFCLHL